MSAGRPTNYDENIKNKVDEYLEICQDENIQLIKMENGEKGYTTYENKLKVNLPTVEGLARFIGVSRDTIYEWAKVHQEFSDTLDKIKIEQKQRLINYGLSGDYNSVIAKLILSSNHDMAERSEVTGKDSKDLIPPSRLDEELENKINDIIVWQKNRSQ